MAARRLASRSAADGTPRTVEIVIDGRRVAAREGEPIAVALWAAGHVVLGRSAKYHRPRGPYCFQGRCDGCLMRVDGVPNVMTCRTPAREGTSVESQNAFPSAELDVFGIVDWFFPRGMDHHQMMTGNVALNRVMQGVARRMAGLGALPSEPHPVVPVHESAIDVLVVGGGVAGLAAATEAARAGASVRVVEEADEVGGEMSSFPGRVLDPDGGDAIDARALVDRLAREARAAGASIAPRTSAVAAYRENAGKSGVRELLVSDGERIERVRPSRVVIASGAHDGVATFEGNDLPGVVSAGAAARLLSHGVLPAERVVIAGDGVLARALAGALEQAGAKVAGAFDARVERASGRGRVKSVVLADGRRFACEALVVAAPPSPAFELAAQAGVSVRWCATRGAFVAAAGDDSTPTDAWAEATGAVTGVRTLPDLLPAARACGRRAADGARGATA